MPKADSQMSNLALAESSQPRRRPAWRDHIAKFEKPSLPRSLRQVANTLIPYFSIIVLMYFTLSVSYWLTLALAFLAAGFLTRAFIIFHDCGHCSFFKSRRANQILEFVTGLLAFMPSYYWAHQHAKHHAHAGDLDHRGDGDVWTVTVDEYLAMPRMKRLWYRTYRNPFFLFGLAPIYLFLVHYRYWHPGDSKRIKWSTIRTNLAIAAIIVTCTLTIGIKAYLMIQAPITIIAGTLGVWLFYVQHQFENVYWARHENWSYEKQALQGSSFYRLPRVLQWFSGNIGFHHVHHLSPRIPNYNLQACHESHEMFANVPYITLWSSMKALHFRLWDEDRKKLVGFSYIGVYLRKLAQQQASGVTAGGPS